jgi:hypothetical protein
MSLGTITITKIEGTCGCLRQSLTQNVLQPGETAKLTVEVNTLTQPAGANRWQFTVNYKLDQPGSATQQGHLLLQIRATLTQEVTITPPQLGFSTTGAASQVLFINDTRSQSLRVVKTAVSSEHLSVDVGEREAGKPQRVTVKLAASAPVGHRDEIVVLYTDDPDYTEFRIPVRILKRPLNGVTAIPDSVALRFAPGQTEIATLVQLRAFDAKPIAIACAESDHPGVVVKVSSGSASVVVVRVTVTESAAQQSGHCQVRVKLTEPAGQEVVIPVSWKR